VTGGENIFVLTGAGISAESGLGTFRDKAGEGIWARFDPMKLGPPKRSHAIPMLCSRFMISAVATF
jgi:NAD-dependent deacetylase